MMMVTLFRDLLQVMVRVSRPVDKALKQYISLNTRLLAGLKHEFAFYLAAVQMIERIRASGLPMCRPELAPKEERVCEVKDSYNVNLALHLIVGAGYSDLKDVVVVNDVIFGSQGRVVILTGPNQGGKTTYT